MFTATSSNTINRSIVRVAVVDDHQLVRTGLVQMIRSLPDFEVVLEAANGKEFQEKWQRLAPPEIVVLDIQMPVMDGYETALWIHTHLPEVRVLVVSMVYSEIAIIRMLRLGVYGFLSKDATLENLQQALTCIKHQQYYVNDLASSRLFHLLSSHPDHLQVVPYPEITDREFIFLRHCCTELSYREIAMRMYVSPRTIDSYRDHLFQKLRVKSRVGLVLFAIKHNLIEMGDGEQVG